jgi:signal transduction histidine kinase
VTAAAVAAGVPRARLDLDLAADVVTLPVHRRTVQQLLTNLLENAVRHGPDGGTVRLAACLDGDVLVLQVADGGRPTSALRRALAGRTDGLGLRIVRSVVADIGGSLHLRNVPAAVVLEVRLPGYGQTAAQWALAD